MSDKLSDPKPRTQSTTKGGICKMATHTCQRRFYCASSAPSSLMVINEDNRRSSEYLVAPLDAASQKNVVFPLPLTLGAEP
ncbi:hypothetical protein CEXT_611411 [Caerostris extrusa]|uniref:Uncharacterized protein n=1 Tax=Caerostris extrusa TaxID=172846 RepID=A0AAV4N443_CAEEX|nr:hypothetical protein CEXT_611411 [Caerostris extrusa]